MPTIHISDEVMRCLKERLKDRETPDEILRRVLGLPPGYWGRKPVNMDNLPKKATNRMRTRIEDGMLKLAFKSGAKREWSLLKKDDQTEVRRIRDQAVEFIIATHGSRGQVHAVKKILTENGYYVKKPTQVKE